MRKGAGVHREPLNRNVFHINLKGDLLSVLPKFLLAFYSFLRKKFCDVTVAPFNITIPTAF